MSEFSDPTDGVALAKRRLRAELLSGRPARSSDDADARLADAASALVNGLTTVAAYTPLRYEPGGRSLLPALAARGVRVLLPVLLPDRDLDWRLVDTPAPLGVEAVLWAELVLVPALAVDRVSGVRLGRGGGSYDRALARVQGPAVALLYDGELIADVPSEAHDRAVDAVLTPSGLAWG